MKRVPAAVAPSRSGNLVPGGTIAGADFSLSLGVEGGGPLTSVGIDPGPVLEAETVNSARTLRDPFIMVDGYDRDPAISYAVLPNYLERGREWRRHLPGNRDFRLSDSLAHLRREAY